MGPLAGVKIVELAGIGPGPFAAMMLADMGADVIRLERPPATPPAPDSVSPDVLNRGRPSVGVNLKHPDAVALTLDLIAGADGLLEGFRPGVMERLGLGPEVCLARNPRLVYGRMTGWGQSGPLAEAAGHDINYIALSGALHAIRRVGEPPLPPLNLVGDFGGGGLLLAFGMACALYEARGSGKGQVVDAAMVDGSSILMTMFHAFKHMGAHDDSRPGTNLLDTGAHFYEVYETADGKYVALGAIEPQFYAEFLRRVGLDAADLPRQYAREEWPALKQRLRALFKQKTRDAWCALLENSDACFAPVLSLSEAPEHPHNRARGAFIEVDGLRQPAPAPRFSRTPPEVRRGAAPAGRDTASALASWGVEPGRVAALRASGAIG